MMKADRREQLKEQLRQVSDHNLDMRVDRYLEINHQGIIGNHYFAPASSECIDVYRDGYFINAVMVSQAVNEGIIKFIAERNSVSRHITNSRSRLRKLLYCLLGKSFQLATRTKSLHDLVEEFVQSGVISPACGESAKRIMNSFRNDVHHMNPNVGQIPFSDLAKRNLQDLAEIEREIFGVDFDNGKLLPKQPKYWDVQHDGTVPVFLRLG